MDKLTWTAWVMAGLVWLAGPVQAGVSTFLPIDDLTGHIQTTNKTYVASGDTLAGTAAATSIQVGQFSNVTPIYQRLRGLLRFDSSTLDGSLQGATIDSVLVKVVITNEKSDTDFRIALIAPVDSLDAGHLNGSMLAKFKNWSVGVKSPVIWSDSVSTVGRALGDTITFRLNAAGIAGLNKTGTSQFYMVSMRDMAGQVTLGSEYWALNDDNPYMQVWYTAPPATTGRTPYNRVNAFDNAAPFNRVGRF